MRYAQIITAIILLAFSNTSYARRHPAEVERIRKMNARYNMHPGDKLVIDNTYGMVHMNTWDKEEVTVDITITVKAAGEDKANDMLNRITFEQESNEQRNHRVYYKTLVASGRSRNNNISIQIDYVINMPRRIPIDITNKYGDIFLDDFAGRATINLSYGALTAKRITGPDKDIHIAYGRGQISSVETGHFDLSYSNFEIDKGQNLNIKNIFGKLSLGTVQTLSIEQKYGDLDFGTIGTLSGNVDYAGIEVDHISKSLDLNLKYCSKVDIRSIDATIERVKINASYSSLSLHLDRNTNLTMDMETSYGDINTSVAKQLGILQQRKTGTSTTYIGKTGNGSGTFSLNTKYTNISIK